MCCGDGVLQASFWTDIQSAITVVRVYIEWLISLPKDNHMT